MLREQRLQYILDQLARENAIRITQISQALDVSYMTIWRDLADLESQEKLRRVRGGAISTASEAAPQAAAFANFDPKQDAHGDKKTLIGQYAARELVTDGDNITIEAGTTASAMLPFLQQKNLTVLTNGLVATIEAARNIPDMTVMCSGGILIETGAFIGPQAQEFFEHFRVKRAFLGAKGLTLEDGFTDPTPLYNELKGAIKASAEEIVVLLDSSKLGVRSLIQVMRLEEVNILVTDYQADPELVEALRQRGIDVRIADQPPEE
ncbi:MAG: DeoR/GlpR transcriptional regulator [Anaerolineales bacterium]|nr:DeoR/GlpR transcriptional regulator [Anaerolineales bacterium]